MVRLLRFAAVLALGGFAAAGLSACSGAGGEGEVTSPSVSVSAAPVETMPPSPPPSVTPEEELLARIPENARVESFPGAVAFVEFFVAESQLILQTRDAELFSYLSGPECGFCESSLSILNRLELSGGSASPGLITVYPDTALGGIEPDETWNVSVDVRVDDQTFFDETGGVTGEYPAEDLRIGVALEFGEGHWQVIGISSEPR